MSPNKTPLGVEQDTTTMTTCEKHPNKTPLLINKTPLFIVPVGSSMVVSCELSTTMQVSCELSNDHR